MGEASEITLSVNGSACRVDADPGTPLVYVLRNKLGLTGTKLGCALEQCGACAVIADGASVLSCTDSVSSFSAREITTIEGLEQTALGRRIQNAFVRARAGQCGYCIPGIVIATYALLKANPRPAREQIVQALSPHLCRCGSHTAIFRAIEVASADE